MPYGKPGNYKADGTKLAIEADVEHHSHRPQRRKILEEKQLPKTTGNYQIQNRKTYQQ